MRRCEERGVNRGGAKREGGVKRAARAFSIRCSERKRLFHTGAQTVDESENRRGEQGARSLADGESRVGAPLRGTGGEAAQLGALPAGERRGGAQRVCAHRDDRQAHALGAEALCRVEHACEGRLKSLLNSGE